MRNTFRNLMSAALVFSAANAHAIDANQMSASAGDIGGNISALSARKEGRVVKLYSSELRGDLDVAFKFSGVAAGSNRVLKARFSQRSAKDVFRFLAQDSKGNATEIGMTTGRGYKDLSFALPSSLAGDVSIRLVTGSGAGDSAMDYLVIDAGAAGPVATPPPPAPSATPKPAPTPAPSPTPAPTPPPSTQVPGSIIKLPVGVSWYWQLQGNINTNVNAAVYDIDLYDTPASTIAMLKNSGRAVVCYFSAGTYENWRSDASSFPADTLGANMDEWPGEKWLDIRKPSVLTIMAKRLDLAKSKGCDAVEPDNVDGYSNRNGVGLTKADQIAYNGALADLARARGLKVALKNSTDLVNALVNKFDFAVVEECFAYNECEAYKPFVDQGKAVLNAEYSKYSATTCTKAKNLGLSTVFFNLALDGKVVNPCP